MRVRPHYAHLTDELVLQVLEESSQAFEDYCNRPDPGTAADSVIVEMACIRLNMLGAEGSSSASEGGVSRTWDTMPETLRARLDAFRRPMWPRSSP